MIDAFFIGKIVLMGGDPGYLMLDGYVFLRKSTGCISVVFTGGSMTPKFLCFHVKMTSKG